MSQHQKALLLQEVVGAALDASSTVRATSALPLLDSRAALIGTSKGSLLLCTPSANAPTVLEPATETVLHCGPVHDISLSAQHLVATAGHDAVTCVFSLHTLFSAEGLTQCRRLSGHTVPVVAVLFMSDGTTLVTLGCDGRVCVVDAIRGDVLAVLSCGFAASCVALSLDETVLYVGGCSLAAMDLEQALRPPAHHTVGPVEAWGSVGSAAAPRTAAGVQLHQWAPEPCAAASGAEAAAEFTQLTPHDVMIASLSVDPRDGTLSAFFGRSQQGGGAARQCGVARWSVSGGRRAVQTVWASLSPSHTPGPSTAAVRGRRPPSATVAVRCKTKSAARPAAKQEAAPSATTNYAPALWHGRWYVSPFELTGTADSLRCHSSVEKAALASVEDCCVVKASTVPLRTPGEEEARAEAQRDELQRECDALVFQIRALRGKTAAA